MDQNNNNGIKQSPVRGQPVLTERLQSLRARIQTPVSAALTRTFSTQFQHFPEDLVFSKPVGGSEFPTVSVPEKRDVKTIPSVAADF